MKHKQGQTIIEMGICMVILAVILIGLYLIFMSGNKSWFEGESFLSVQQIVREVLRGKGAWRGMPAEIRTMHKIIGAFPDDPGTGTNLCRYKLRFVGETYIFAGNNGRAETLCRTGSDDIQLIDTGTTNLSGTATIILAGADGILQSIPGDLNGNGTTVDDPQGWDDYTDALIIDGDNRVCNTTKSGDDIQEVLSGVACGKGDILISQGSDNKLQTLPNEDDFRVAPLVIGYEFKDKMIYRTINDNPPDPEKGHIGPYIVAKNIESLEFHYLQSDGITEVLPGSVSQTMLTTITQIEIKGTSAITKKNGEILKAPFKTRIQPRAMNPVI